MATTRKSVRDFLVQQGISNDAIGYNNGTVTVGGRNFISARPEADGRTYAAENDLARAYSVYDSNRRKQTVNQRSNDLYNQIGSLREQLTQPQEAFSYNPMADPQYQAALNQARQTAQTGTNNAMVALGSRGIGNSSSAVTAANQIQQRELGRVSDTLLPQMMQQAYQRYMNDRTAQRQAIMDQLGLFESQYGMVQQDDANRYRDLAFDQGVYEGNRNFDRGVFESDRNFDRGVLESDRAFDRGVLESDRLFDRNVFESNRNFDRGVLESDRNFNRGVLESDRSYGLQRDNFNLQRDDRNLDNLYRQWEVTGVAPAGIPGVEPGTPYDSSTPTPRSGTLTANQFLSSVQSQYLEPVMSEYGMPTGEARMTSDPARREQMFLQVVDAGYDDATTYQLLGALGFTGNEINQYLSKYGGQ